MSMIDRVDPESRIPLDALNAALPGGFNAIADLATRRATLDGMLAMMTADIPPNPNISIEDTSIPGPAGAPDIAIRVYRPNTPAASKPGILFIHGGGMILGNLETDSLAAAALCEFTGAVVLSVDYRLAPESPAPAAIEDCYAALRWMHAASSELGFDPTRLAVYGGSAGGGLAIATALVARDRGTPIISFVMAPYPMIDDRNETDSSKAVVDLGIWDRAGNIEAWAWYLGGKPADQYSAPARATDLSNLPPMFIDVGDCDMFMDEDIAFVEKLKADGGTVEFIVYPGAYHASEVFAPAAALSAKISGRRIEALKEALA
jgi:acetyl esterase/lipase